MFCLITSIKVNYWLRYGEDENQATQASFSGQIEQALVIGLLPDTWYYVSVQVYNDAGNGQKSEKYPQKTFRRGKIVKYLQIRCRKGKRKTNPLKTFRRGKSVKSTHRERLERIRVRLSSYRECSEGVIVGRAIHLSHERLATKNSNDSKIPLENIQKG